MSSPLPIGWVQARSAAYAAGREAMPAPVEVDLRHADGLTLAHDLRSRTDLPAFPTSSVDGYAVAGTGPWRLAGRVLAGSEAGPVRPGEAIEVATGAMVPAGTDAIIRLEDAELGNGQLTGEPRPHREWREPGEEALAGESLLPAGTPISPAVIGLAATCGYDAVAVHPAPRVGVVVFGDELLTTGVAGKGRVRDSLGPQLPPWLRRLGATPAVGFDPLGPVADTLPAHLDAIRAGLADCDVVATTGGTMRGPVDHLHPALAELGAEYVADTVAVRPGFPMLLARVRGATSDGRPRFVVGLPGNPQSAIVALACLVVPLLAGLCGRAQPKPTTVTLAEPIGGRGDFAHLALVRLDDDGRAQPLRHVGSAMLRGVAQADGFAVITPGSDGRAGDRVPLLALPGWGGA